jgi:DNA-binding NarL/FixJ family response regulator
VARNLTPRQLDVVGELMRGGSNKTIAHALGIGEATVKVHLRNIMKKFGCTNRVQVVLRMGLVALAAPKPEGRRRDVGCW